MTSGMLIWWICQIRKRKTTVLRLYLLLSIYFLNSYGCNLFRTRKIKVSVQCLNMFFEKAVLLPDFIQIKARNSDPKPSMLYGMSKTSIICMPRIPMSKPIMPSKWLIKTIKTKLYRIHKQSYRYVDKLQDFARKYNATYDRTIGMLPVKVTIVKERVIWFRD